MEERVKKAELRIKTVEEAILLLSKKMLIHDDWWDEHRAFQADTDAKIAALIDAQIKNEDDIKEFRQATKKMFAHLIKMLDKMDKRIELLEKKNNNKNGKSK